MSWNQSQEGKSRAGYREGLGRPVGERIEAQPAAAQRVEHLYCFGDGIAQHGWPPGLPRRNQLGVLGELALALGDGIVEGLTGIHLAIPLGRDHRGEELFHGGFVAAEQRAVKVAGVPVDQNPAQVEQNCVYFGCVRHF